MLSIYISDSGLASNISGSTVTFDQLQLL